MPVVFLLIHCGFARGVAVVVAIAEREVGGVVRHGMPLGSNAHTHARQREVGVRGLGYGNAFYRVAFVAFNGIESVVETHIGVERVIAWARFLLCYRIVERRCNLGLIGEELAKVEVGGQTIRFIVVGGTLGHAIFQSAETITDILACEVYGTKVRQLHVQVSCCCPSASVVKLFQT